MTQRIILDVDTGTDDAVALMAAALSPDLDLIGATTVNGNQAVDICTENTLRVFDHIGVDVPVFEGADLPLVATLTPGRKPGIPRRDPSPVHGSYLDLPEASSKVQSQNAVDWLIETYMQSDGDIIYVPVGPLTNLGMAIRLEPRIVEQIPEIVIMGGSHAIGNVTPAAEFNIWVDPEAARIVLNCGRPIRLIPLDATHKALVSTKDCAALRALGTPAASAAASFIETRIQGYSQGLPEEFQDAAPVHDALAVCAIIEPSVVESAFVHADVETRGELTDGRTVVDMYQRSGREANAHFALDADQDKFVAMLMDILGRTAA